MTNDNLLKKLKILQSVNIWNFQAPIKDSITSGNIEVISGEYNDESFQAENTIMIGEISCLNNEIIISIAIWEQSDKLDLTTGDKEVTLKLINNDPEKFLYYFIQDISNKWRTHLECEVEKEEQEKKRKRMLQIEAYLLR